MLNPDLVLVIVEVTKTIALLPFLISVDDSIISTPNITKITKKNKTRNFHSMFSR